MIPFEYFDHTADTLFKAYGASLEDALANTILAVYNVIVDTSTIKLVEERSFVVSAPKKETLVYELIDELLFLLDTESFLGAKVTALSLTKKDGVFSLQVTISGDADASKYDVFGQIKAPTYSDMLICEEKENIFIQAVLDL